MSYVLECIGVGASYYNLAIAAIVFALFIKMIRMKSRISILPWKIIFAGFCIYIIEEVLTVMSKLNFVVLPVVLFPIFEMIIILLFIYALLEQRESLKRGK